MLCGRFAALCLALARSPGRPGGRRQAAAPAARGAVRELQTGPATIAQPLVQVQVPGVHPRGRHLLHHRSGRHALGPLQALPGQPLPLAADLGPEPVHHRRPLDLSRRPADPAQGRAGHRPRGRGRGGVGDGADGEGTARAGVGATAGGDVLYPAIEEMALQCAPLHRRRPRGREPARHRLRARRDQDRLRRPRHPVPEQGQQRGRQGRATSTRSTTTPTR